MRPARGRAAPLESRHSSSERRGHLGRAPRADHRRVRAGMRRCERRAAGQRWERRGSRGSRCGHHPTNDGYDAVPDPSLVGSHLLSDRSLTRDGQGRQAVRWPQTASACRGPPTAASGPAGAGRWPWEAYERTGRTAVARANHQRAAPLAGEPAERERAGGAPRHQISEFRARASVAAHRALPGRRGRIDSMKLGHEG